MYSEKNNLDSLLEISPTRHRTSSLSIHPYFGKVDPSLASKAIELLSQPGETILDPFCGSGTVIHDAIGKGRNAIGWDSSPLAILISTGKILGILPEEERELSSFTASVCDADGLFGGSKELHDTQIPLMPRVRAVSDWFAPNALRELAHIRNRLENASNTLTPASFLYAKLAFSRIITSSSLQRGESSYCRVEKSDEVGRVFDLYRKSVSSIIKLSKAFSKENFKELGELRKDRLVSTATGYTVSHRNLNVELKLKDSRKNFSENSCQNLASLVTTSPPYLMSWDYGLYHKFRFYWLGFDLDGYEDTEIGRHLRRKNDDVPRYTEDMTKVFDSLRIATTASSHVFMVNAVSVVYGKEVDTNQLLINCAAESGWKCVWDKPTIDIPGPHHGMYGSLASRGASAPGAAGKKEHVLVFGK